MNLASRLRRMGQAVRHARALRRLAPLWSVLRPLYMATIERLARKHGLVVQIAGVDIVVDPVFATQNWESLEVANYNRFREAARGAKVVFDVGGHIGTYSILAAKSMSAGTVVCFEPVPFTLSYLRKHIEWNGCCDRVKVCAMCCGRAAGVATLYVNDGVAEGMNGIVPVEGFSRAEFPMTSLDNEGDRLRLTPDVIKIDVEGGELEVLRGASRLLEQRRPVLFVSLHPDALAKLSLTPEDVIRYVSGFGYRHEIIATDHEIHALFSPSENANPPLC